MNGEGDDGEFLSLVTNRPVAGGETDKRPDEAVALGNAFATAKGQRLAESIEFQRQDRTSFTMPYGYRPITWWYPDDTILIEYPGFFTVGLTGKNLKDLQQRICDQRVTWVGECDARFAASLPIAVARIESLRAYPSREAGSDPREGKT